MKTQNTQPNGIAQTVRATFSRETAVCIDIAADAAIVWSLLTNAADYPRWNPTVLSLTGNIAVGNTIQLVSAIAPKRTFKLKVKKMEPNKSMSWADAMGGRTYTLQQIENGVRFSMHERIAGPLFPLFAAMIPPFDKPFEEFAAALKQEAETIQNKKA